jgi:hypothetical protein
MMFRARWDGQTLTPVGAYGLSAARDKMDDGDLVIVEVDHPRSINSHRHQFAEIAEAWRHLPEAVQMHEWAASPETLRKHALIVTGYRNTYQIDCGANATAERVKKALHDAEAGKHGYAIAQARGPVVIVWTPESQSMRAMGAKRFQQSKDAVLNWIAQQIGVTAEQLSPGPVR